MGASSTINSLVYTYVRGLPKNRVKAYKPIDSWIVKYQTKINEKYDS